MLLLHSIAGSLALASLALAQPTDFFQRVVSRQAAANDSAATTTCATSNGLDPSSFDPPLYTEKYRSQLHFSPSSGFMNDPNGLSYSNGTWHMYYQYNPRDPVAGFQHWGHATSTDLYTWQNYVPAIAPVNDTEGIFSGSAVLDVNNTSGFFDDATPAESRFVAIYTLNTPTDQNQNIAYSTDGQNYTKYSGNPVISLNTTQFRDPKVFWDEKMTRWVMTVAHSQNFTLGFYGSTDLKSWTELSQFGPSGLLGYQYECPDLVQVPIEGGERDGQTAWVLVLSINPGAPLGGSFVQTFLGDWNGTAFVPFDRSIQIADFGKEFYAPQTFYNAPDGKAILIGWASNWQTTNVVPTSPWRSTMTIPRELVVRWTPLNPMLSGYQVVQKPYLLDALPNRQTLVDNSTASSSNQTVNLQGSGAFDIQANFSLAANKLNVTNPRAEVRVLSGNEGEYVNFGILFGDPTVVYVDRRFAGRQWADSQPFFTDRFSQQFTAARRTPGDTTSDVLVSLRIVVDRALMEVFAQDGVASAAVLAFWDNDAVPASITLGLGDEAVVVEGLRVQAINSTWPACP